MDLKKEDDQVLEFVIPDACLERDRFEKGSEGDGVVVFVGNIEVPHRAHDGPLFAPGMIDCRDVVDSSRRLLDCMGSMLRCPLHIAERTDRLESQFKDGAESKRTVGSLRVNVSLSD